MSHLTQWLVRPMLAFLLMMPTLAIAVAVPETAPPQMPLPDAAIPNSATPPAAEQNNPANAKKLPLTTLDDKDIKDPTQMTGSFSEALGRITGKSDHNGGRGGNDNKPTTPPIFVVSKAIAQNGGRTILLDIGGKTYKGTQGGKFAFLWQDAWFEIEVKHIDFDAVILTLLPAKKELVLQ